MDSSVEASISAYGNGSSTHHMSALATAPPPHQEHHSSNNHTYHPTHLYQPSATLHNPNILTHQTPYQPSGQPHRNTLTTRPALGETCVNTHTPPNAHFDDAEYLRENTGLLKAKLAQRRRQRAERAVDRQIGRSQKFGPKEEGLGDSENQGSMPVPYSEYRTRCREKQRAEASTGPWDEEMEAAFMEGMCFYFSISRRV